MLIGVFTASVSMQNRASTLGAPRGDLIDALGNHFLTVTWSLPVATVFLKVNGR